MTPTARQKEGEAGAEITGLGHAHTFASPRRDGVDCALDVQRLGKCYDSPTTPLS